MKTNENNWFSNFVIGPFVSFGKNILRYLETLLDPSQDEINIFNKKDKIFLQDSKDIFSKILYKEISKGVTFNESVDDIVERMYLNIKI